MTQLVNDTAWETRASTTRTAELSAPTARTPAATTRPAARRGARRPRQDNGATGQQHCASDARQLPPKRTNRTTSWLSDARSCSNNSANCMARSPNTTPRQCRNWSTTQRGRRAPAPPKPPYRPIARSTTRAATATTRPPARRGARRPRVDCVAIGQRHCAGDARQHRRNRPAARANDAGFTSAPPKPLYCIHRRKPTQEPPNDQDLQ